MSRKRAIQPSAAEVAFNLFAKLGDSERSEFAASVYGRSLRAALEDAYNRSKSIGVAVDGQ